MRVAWVTAIVLVAMLGGRDVAVAESPPKGAVPFPVNKTGRP